MAPPDIVLRGVHVSSAANNAISPPTHGGAVDFEDLLELLRAEHTRQAAACQELQDEARLLRKQLLTSVSSTRGSEGHTSKDDDRGLGSPSSSSGMDNNRAPETHSFATLPNVCDHDSSPSIAAEDDGASITPVLPVQYHCETAGEDKASSKVAVPPCGKEEEHQEEPWEPSASATEAEPETPRTPLTPAHRAQVLPIRTRRKRERKEEGAWASVAPATAGRPSTSPKTSPKFSKSFSPIFHGSLHHKALTPLSSKSKLSIRDAVEMANMKFVKTSPYLINPERSTFLQKWDLVTSLALVFVVLVTPVQVGLMEPTVDFMLFASMAIDAVFFADLCLQFFLMYPRRTGFGLIWEDRHRLIVRNYLTGWFCVDFLSVLPFDVVSIIFQVEVVGRIKMVKVVRLLRLLKLIRILKASRLVRRLEVEVGVTYQRLALWKFLILLVVISHWLACLWAMTLTMVDEDDGVPRWVDAFDGLEENVAVKTRDSPMRQYIASLYFTSYTITSVGYGDMGPMNYLERIVCTLMVYICGISWAYVLGQICGIVSSMDMHEKEFRRKMDDLNLMMEDRSLCQSMRRRLRMFFLQTKDIHRQYRHDELLKSLSPALQGEVCLAMNHVWISKVSFLHDLMRPYDVNDPIPLFLADLAKALRKEVYAPGEIFGREEALYILNRGLVSRRVRVLTTGAVWGEDFILADKGLREIGRCFALTTVEVCTVDAKIFLDIVDHHRETFPQLAQRVRHHCVRLAARRGILLEAKRRMRASPKALKAVESKRQAPPAPSSRFGNVFDSPEEEAHAFLQVPVGD